MSLSYSVSFFNAKHFSDNSYSVEIIEFFCTLLEVLIDLNQKLERICSGGFVSSFIHSLKAISTNRAQNFDSWPDFTTFFEQKQGLVEKLYFWELRKFKESFQLLKSNVFLNILTRINCLSDYNKRQVPLLNGSRNLSAMVFKKCNQMLTRKIRK